MALFRRSEEQPGGSQEEKSHRHQLEVVPYPSEKQRGQKPDSQYFGEGTELPFVQETIGTEEEKNRVQLLKNIREELDVAFGSDIGGYTPSGLKNPFSSVEQPDETNPWAGDRNVAKTEAHERGYEEHRRNRQEIAELRRAKQERGE